MQPDKLQRHFLPATFDNRGIRILLVGCGGNGAQMLMGLASLDTALRAIGLPERAQYALAYTMFKQADECAIAARVDEADRWAKAFVDGRIRKRRRAGKRYVHIETPAEKERRCA